MTRRMGVVAAGLAVGGLVGRGLDGERPNGPAGSAGRALAAQAAELTVELVGNAGVALRHGRTTLLVDLPYESGAFGYQRYDPSELRPTGTVVSVITHHHRDHFDASLFVERSDWGIVGPPSVVAGLPPARVLAGDSVQVGAFAVIVLPTPHTDDHRSYRVRWGGRVLHFVGDTEDPGAVAAGPQADVLFVTPWLSCALAERDVTKFGRRSVLYHRRPDGGDRACGPVETLEQGTRFTVAGEGA